MMTARAVSFVLATMALSACVHQIGAPQAGPYPRNYRQVVTSFIDVNFDDPSSPKRIAISAPRPREDLEARQRGWVVCLLVTDANDPYGVYGRELVSAVLIEDGQARRGSYGLAEDCLTASYAPWPG